MMRAHTFVIALALASAPIAHAQDDVAPIVRVLVDQEYDAGLAPIDFSVDALYRHVRHAERLMNDSWQATVSELRAAHGREELLPIALYLIETGRRGGELAERWLDEGAPGDAPLTDEESDRLAATLESTLPLTAARGAVLAAFALERSEPEAARRLAAEALDFAEASDAEGAMLLLTRAHAQRLLGRHEAALAAYTRVDDAIGVGERLRRPALLTEASLGGVLAAHGSGAGMDEALGALERMRTRDGLLPANALAPLIADVAFAVRAADETDPARLVARHEALLVERLSDPRLQRSWHAGLQPALAEIGERLGGAPAAGRLPVACLLAMGVEQRPEALDLLRTGYEKAEAAWPERPALWSRTAYEFAIRALSLREDESLGVRALLDLAQRAPSFPENKLALLRLRLANRNGLMTGPQRDDWLALLREPPGELGPFEGEGSWVLGVSLLEELERRVDTHNHTELLTETQAALEKDAALLTRFSALRVYGAALRTLDWDDPRRAGVAERTLELARTVEARRSGEREHPGLATHAWDVYAADALLVLGRPEEALALLPPVRSRERDAQPLDFAYRRSIRRVRAHAQAMLGDAEAAATTLAPMIGDNDPAFLLRGSPFTPDRAYAEGLAEAFVGDEHEPTEREVLEARYALVRSALGARDPRITRDGAACAQDAALLIRAGLAEEALALIDGCDGEGVTLRLMRAEAHLRAGDAVSAFALYRELANGLGATAERRATREHWHAWARMLEVLERQNADGSRTEAITDAVRRLKALPSWGTWPECVERIEGVGERVGA